MIKILFHLVYSPRRLDVFPFVISYLVWIFFYAKNYYETAIETPPAPQVLQLAPVLNATEQGVCLEEGTAGNKTLDELIVDQLPSVVVNNIHASHLLILAVILVLSHVSFFTYP